MSSSYLFHIDGSIFSFTRRQSKNGLRSKDHLRADALQSPRLSLPPPSTPPLDQAVCRRKERDGELERGLLTCEKEATAVPELDEENLQAQTAKRKEVKTETSATLCRRNTGTR